MSEIHQKTKTKPRRFQIIQQLSLMFQHDFPDGFEFDNDRILADKVRSKCMSQPSAFVLQNQFRMRLKRKTTPGHFILQALLIHGFKKPTPILDRLRILPLDIECFFFKKNGFLRYSESCFRRCHGNSDKH